MLVLLCVQVVQTNNNESSRRGKKKLSNVFKQKIRELVKKVEIFNLKNLIDKIHKQKELKLNVNCQIKKSRNHNFLQI
jgi:hypothetical protein